MIFMVIGLGEAKKQCTVAPSFVLHRQRFRYIRKTCDLLESFAEFRGDGLILMPFFVEVGVAWLLSPSSARSCTATARKYAEGAGSLLAALLSLRGLQP